MSGTVRPRPPPAFCSTVYSCMIRSAFRSASVFLRFFPAPPPGRRDGGRGASLTAHRPPSPDADADAGGGGGRRAWTEPHAPRPRRGPTVYGRDGRPIFSPSADMVSSFWVILDAPHGLLSTVLSLSEETVAIVHRGA